MVRFGWVVVAMGLAGCAPQVVGQQVGQSLYNASVNTGNALANLGDRTGAALQNAGTNLRQSVNPPPPPDDAPAPVYDPQGNSRFAPVQSAPLN